MRAPVRRSTMARREALDGFLFALPWFLGFVLLTAGPMAASLYLSLTNYNMLSPPQWVGLANYQKLFTGDPLFWTALGNTAYYVLFSVPLSMVGSLALSLLLNQPLWGIRLWRTLFYLPAVTSGVAVILLWAWLLNPDVGLVNRGLAWLHLPQPAWLADPAWSKPALILMSLWGLGSGMVIYLAGLQAIPQHLYEAAEIDGAGRWRRFLSVTLPMLSPTIFFNLILNVISSFQVFTQAFVLTQGGPLNSTLFYVLYLFQQAFRFLHMGMASAMAWVLLVIVLAMTVVQFAFSGRWVYYEGETRR